MFIVETLTASTVPMMKIQCGSGNRVKEADKFIQVKHHFHATGKPVPTQLHGTLTTMLTTGRQLYGSLVMFLRE